MPTEAAELRWSTQTVIRRLKAHGIPTVGHGRIARLTVTNFQRIVEVETQPPPVRRDPQPHAFGGAGYEDYPYHDEFRGVAYRLGIPWPPQTQGDKIRLGKAVWSGVRRRIQAEAVPDGQWQRRKRRPR